MSTPTLTDRPPLDRTSPEQRRLTRRVLLSSYLGTTIEYYDFLLYGTAAALVFPAVFFAGVDPAAGVILSLGTFAAGYVARPLGGLIFGHFGDRLGRKNILIITLMMMGVASTLIGLIPGSATIGSWGAILLVLLRVVQGLAVGGEWGGAAVMAMEHTTTARRGLSTSIVGAGAPSGALLGTAILGVFALLPEEQFLAWGWRVPFILSAVLLVIGLWVRLSVTETPVYTETASARQRRGGRRGEAQRAGLPLWSVLRRPRILILVTLATMAPLSMQSSMATFGNTYAAQVGGLSRSNVLFAFSIATFISIFAVVLSGWLSDRVGRKPVIIGAIVVFGASTGVIFAALASGSVFFATLGFTFGLLCQTIAFGPLTAFIGEQFATTARQTGASLGYQLGTLLGAGFTPAILATLLAQSGDTWTISLFLGGLAAVSLVALLLTRESNRNDLRTIQH